MQFNNETVGEENGICQDIDFLCNTNTATYPVVDKTRNVNRWNAYCVVEIIDSMDEWDFRGKKVYKDLTANQQPYALDTDILTVKRIEIDYDGDGVYVKAEPMDPGSVDDTIATSAEINDIWSTNSPQYDLFGHSALVYPVPTTTRSSGIVIWQTNDVAGFTATAGGNTAEPVFVESFHRVLSLGASLDFAQKYRMADLIRFCKDELYGPSISGKDRMGGLISKMKAFYSTRASDKILQFRSKYYQKNYK